MELRPFILQPNMTKLLPLLTTRCVTVADDKHSWYTQKINNFSNLHENPPKKESSLKIGRRVGIIALSSSSLCALWSPQSSEEAIAFEFGFVASDQQTIEEAESGVRGHAKELLEVKGLLEAESWKQAQRTLRQSSALLKKDIYTIIQNKPGAKRPLLRKLYSTLFNNVSRLDYAARDKDLPEIWLRYKNIVVAVDDILSRI